MILGTTWLGTLPAWLTFAGLLIMLYVFRGSSPGTALEIEQRTNRTLKRRVDELEAAQKFDRAAIAVLTAKTDISLAIQPMIDWCHAHEKLAEARAEQIMVAIGKAA